nr:unnamed protein product [Digitaria exilis]
MKVMGVVEAARWMQAMEDDRRVPEDKGRAWNQDAAENQKLCGVRKQLQRNDQREEAATFVLITTSDQQSTLLAVCHSLRRAAVAARQQATTPLPQTWESGSESRLCGCFPLPTQKMPDMARPTNPSPKPRPRGSGASRPTHGKRGFEDTQAERTIYSTTDLANSLDINHGRDLHGGAHFWDPRHLVMWAPWWDPYKLRMCDRSDDRGNADDVAQCGCPV